MLNCEWLGSRLEPGPPLFVFGCVKLVLRRPAVMPVRSAVSTAWLLRALALPSLGHADILTHGLVVIFDVLRGFVYQTRAKDPP